VKISFLVSYAPFKGYRGIVQTFCLQQLMTLKDCDVTVFGHAKGVKDACMTFGCQQVSCVESGLDRGLSYGKLFIDDLIKKAQQTVLGDYVVYIAGDVFVLSSNSLLDLFDSIGYPFGGWMRPLAMPEYKRFRYVSFERGKQLVQGAVCGQHLSRIERGVDVLIWSRDVFDKLRVPPFLIESWRHDLWMANNFPTENVWCFNNTIEAVHIGPHGDHQTSIDQKACQYNLRLYKKLEGDEEGFIARPMLERNA